jgi:hypothetical protein
LEVAFLNRGANIGGFIVGKTNVINISNKLGPDDSCVPLHAPVCRRFTGERHDVFPDFF